MIEVCVLFAGEAPMLIYRSRGKEHRRNGANRRTARVQARATTRLRQATSEIAGSSCPCLNERRHRQLESRNNKYLRRRRRGQRGRRVTRGALAPRWRSRRRRRVLVFAERLQTCSW